MSTLNKTAPYKHLICKVMAPQWLNVLLVEGLEK